MRRLRIEIDRLQVSAPGMAPATAAAALSGLAADIEARLERTPLGGGIRARLEVDQRSIGQLGAPRDAAALRAAIAEGLVDRLRRLARAGEEA